MDVVEGRSALAYLIKVRGYTFLDAVEKIAGQAAIQSPVSMPVRKTAEKKLLLLQQNRTHTRSVSYLQGRGIGTDFIEDANGSDKNYSFSIPADEKSGIVHLFESAIDLLSYATFIEDGREELERRTPVISCRSVSASKGNRAE